MRVMGHKKTFEILTTQPAFTCSKLTIETQEQVFIVNFKHVSHLLLVFLLLTLNEQLPAG